jgi:hypothetical protein
MYHLGIRQLGREINFVHSSTIYLRCLVVVGSPLLPGYTLFPLLASIALYGETWSIVYIYNR